MTTGVVVGERGFLEGRLLDQKYRIGRQLGEGGMGAVYRATHLGTMRTVAVKVIRPRFSTDQEFVERFRREAEKARPRLRTGMHLAIMDGHRLAMRSASCDAVVLHLIVAVIPDPVRCLQEVARVLRPGGRAIVFDKFTRGARPSLPLRLLNVLSGALFTEVTRNFETILDQAGGLGVERDEPALFGGVFRHILLRKPA